MDSNPEPKTLGIGVAALAVSVATFGAYVAITSNSNTHGVSPRQLALATQADTSPTNEATAGSVPSDLIEKMRDAENQYQQLAMGKAARGKTSERDREVLLTMAIDYADQILQHQEATEDQHSESRRAKLLALHMAAEVNPKRFIDQAEEYCAQLIEQDGNASVAGYAYAYRFARQYLSGPAGSQPLLASADSKAIQELYAFTESYPDNELGVPLYLEVIARLLAQNDRSAAIDVAKRGIRAYGSDPKSNLLTERLAWLDSAGRLPWWSVPRRQDQAPSSDSSPPSVDDAASPFASLMGEQMVVAGPTLRGRHFNISSLRGKLVLVNFWATWCPACRREIPELKRLRGRYQSRGLEIVGISLDSNKRALSDFVKENQIRWRQIFIRNPGTAGWTNPIAKQHRVETIPNAFLLDRTGHVVAAGLTGSPEIERAVQRLFRD